MVCSCSCTSRTKGLLVGASDLILVGYGVIRFILAMLVTRDMALVGWAYDPLFYPEYLGILLPVLLMGTCTISAVVYKSNYCLIIATGLRTLWAICWLSFAGTLYLEVFWKGGYKTNTFWEALRTTLIPGCYAIAQTYFIYVVLNDRIQDLANLQEGKGEGEKLSPNTTTEPEFAPLATSQSGRQDKV